ncbi:MAG: hypothetical protein OXR66_04545 [Candidatus Woesearchaeota archaeon]|nr:hypothetical protein [Candidatus Woesearchaeota archaeon]
MDTSILEDIGLTGAEIKVFIALMELGSSTAGPVVERSGLQNAVVHKAFHSLGAKGLITYAMEGRIRWYQAVEPKLLLGFLDEKKTRLAKLLPELEAKREIAKHKPQATTYQGARGVKELINLMIETDATQYYAYGGSQFAHDLLGDYFWENFHTRRSKNGINGSILFHSSLKTWGKELNKYKKTTVKITDTDFEELTETIICGDRVAIIVYLEKPYGFLLDEERAARSYRNFFQLIWKEAIK